MKIKNLSINKVSTTKNDATKSLVSPLKNNVKDEFNSLLQKKILNNEQNSDSNYGIQVSGHAEKRLKERNLLIDGGEFFKIREAINKLKNKGGKDSLVITDNAAYIIDVQKNKIVTALDKSKMTENVFTKIDSTLFVD